MFSNLRMYFVLQGTLVMIQIYSWNFTRQFRLVIKRFFLIFGNHDLTIGNQDYFQNNPFTETQPKLDFLKAELEKLGNVSILDGTVEEFEGVKFGGTMAFNDFCWAYKIDPEPEGNMAKFLCHWRDWFDYRHWEYMGNVHKDILDSQMKNWITWFPKNLIS